MYILIVTSLLSLFALLGYSNVPWSELMSQPYLFLPRSIVIEVKKQNLFIFTIIIIIIIITIIIIIFNNLLFV